MRGEAMIVCVAANPSVDKLFEVGRVEVGTIHRPIAFTQVPGGKGLNCARAAHALGADVTATGILAGHAGRWVEEALAAEGVSARFAWVDGETRASLSVADASGRGLTEFYERGTDIGPGGWERLEDVVRELCAGASWMTISGNVPLGAPADAYARLTRIAAGAGVLVALDARDEALALGLDAGPAIVKVNAEEAGGLLGGDVRGEADAALAVREIRSRIRGESAAVIVTRGAEGAVVVAPDNAVLRARLYERGPYPVGSGDAFLGGLVSALEQGHDWDAALRAALGAAAANAEVPGAGRLETARARALAGRAHVEPIDRPARRNVP
jgi:1-phosphofructokinase family hexose kinase